MLTILETLTLTYYRTLHHPTGASMALLLEALLPVLEAAVGADARLLLVVVQQQQVMRTATVVVKTETGSVQEDVVITGGDVEGMTDELLEAAPGRQKAMLMVTATGKACELRKMTMREEKQQPP